MWRSLSIVLAVTVLGCSLIRGGLAQDPSDCISTSAISAAAVLNVPSGTVCFQCLLRVSMGFEVGGSPIPADQGGVVNSLLVVLDTTVTFHPSTPVTVRCFGMFGNIHQATVFLDVHEPPIITGVTSVNEGSTLSLNCDSSNSNQQPPVQWFNPQNTVVSSEAQLTLPNIMTSQAGTYTCVTTPPDPADSGSSSVEVVVTAPAPPRTGGCSSFRKRREL